MTSALNSYRFGFDRSWRLLRRWTNGIQIPPLHRPPQLKRPRRFTAKLVGPNPDRITHALPAKATPKYTEARTAYHPSPRQGTTDTPKEAR